MSNRFLGWLIWFAGCLVSVPVLIMFNQIGLAKVIGVLTVISLVIALRIWLNRSKKEFNPIEIIKINANDRFYLKSICAIYNSFSNADKLAFESRIGLFLAKSKVYSQSDLSREDYIKISALFVWANWDDSDWVNFSFKNISIHIAENNHWQISILNDGLEITESVQLSNFMKIPEDLASEQKIKFK